MKDRNIKNHKKANQRLFSITFVLLLLFASNCLGQIKYNALNIGDDVSNTPAFKNVVNCSSDHLLLKDLKGKIIILDFWSTGCSSCIASIPHLEQLQHDFDGKIQIIMVNPWEQKSKILERVSKMKIIRRGIGLTTLPNVYGDTIWRTIFPHTALPHHVWIDREGKVIATTTSVNTTKEHIQEILEGKTISLSIKKDLKSRGYDERKQGLMQIGDTSIRLRFYSGFSKSNSGFGRGTKIQIDSVHKLYKRSIFNEPILKLFQTAYKNYPILLEVKDSSKYLRPLDPNRFDNWFRDNCYCYEITLPVSQQDSIYNYIKVDLNRFFAIEKQIQGEIESRKFMSFVLTKSNAIVNKAKDFSKKDTVIETPSMYKFRNVPFSKIVSYLKYNVESSLSPLVFIDDTQIDERSIFSIDMPKDLKDKEKLKIILVKQGLDFSLEEKNRTVLVIKDIKELVKN